jgi:hypothetical protein
MAKKAKPAEQPPERASITTGKGADKSAKENPPKPEQ